MMGKMKVVPYDTILNYSDICVRLLMFTMYLVKTKIVDFAPCHLNLVTAFFTRGKFAYFSLTP